MKFERGNLVEITYGHPLYTISGPNKGKVEDICKYKVGKQAVVEYSYAEKYGNPNPAHKLQDNEQSYAIRFIDNGNGEAWYKEWQLKLIEVGGEHLINKALENSNTKSPE